MQRFFYTLVLISLFTALYAQEEPKEESLQDRIARLVSNLANDNWHERESAQQELIKLGKSAIQAVLEATKSPDFEVRLRARKILSNICLVSPEEQKELEELIKQYFELKIESTSRADVINTGLSIIRKIRRIKNSQHYIIESIVEEKDLEKKQKLAQILNGSEYLEIFRRVNSELDFIQDVLISIARDPVAPGILRTKAVKSLASFKATDSVGALIDLLQEEPDILPTGASRARFPSNLPLEITEALKTITAAEKAPERKLPSEVGELDKQFWKDWWEKNSETEQYSVSAKDLSVRKKVESEWKRAPSPLLGVMRQDPSTEEGGALIAGVQDSSGAAKAGIQAGDIIVEFNGQKINNWENLTHEILRSKVGQKVKITVLRDEGKLTLEAEIGQRETGN